MAERVAVVTGATGTLGTEVVRALAGLGCRVLAVSRSGIAPDAGEHAVLAADLADDSATAAITGALPDGQVVMAVHAVGLPAAPNVIAVEPGLLGDAVNIKAGGFLRLLHAVEGRLAPDARLVAVGGHMGIEPTEHSPLAGVANAALANLVRQLVAPVGQRGATVHLVAPGPFESDRVDALLARKAASLGVPVEDVRAELMAEQPLGRLPNATDVADIITMLLTPAASALHGSTLFLDAGARRSIF